MSEKINNTLTMYWKLEDVLSSPTLCKDYAAAITDASRGTIPCLRGYLMDLPGRFEVHYTDTKEARRHLYKILKELRPRLSKSFLNYLGTTYYKRVIQVCL